MPLACEMACGLPGAHLLYLAGLTNLVAQGGELVTLEEAGFVAGSCTDCGAVVLRTVMGCGCFFDAEVVWS